MHASITIAKNRFGKIICSTGCPKINKQFEMAGIQFVFKIFLKTQKSDFYKIRLCLSPILEAKNSYFNLNKNLVSMNTTELW